ncbi:recombinase family protein [Pelotomaculum isophthalicicum JI]|uniref:Recombinase family protein n=1 Tax=Pelotomaculum isophthalicicum JI TaxID=947010 RepID=A0A9X4GXR1_9FIRM|nr:recombinase family protein [Pelotomaculum isophthalicicum]MDF9407085.1 recombinase family protein [Pelotomaculum isophthalicicum JI]
MNRECNMPSIHETGDGTRGKLVAVYARLSVNENGERDESLETQCDLLNGFVQKNKFGKSKLYVDNDESGVYFDRPGLIQLIHDIKNNLVDTVIVKDLSRLGRNNGETLTFLDFLINNNVRLISVVDNYDSFADDDEIIGIKTWANEHYCRDISKKVRANLKRKIQNGEYLGKPHFGYLKSTCEKNKLVVDGRYQKIIRMIFDMYINGWGYRALAEYIQNMNIPTPSQDKNYPGAKKSDRWNEQHIRRIITNRVYCGDTIQGVSEKVSFKLRKTRRLPPEKWVVVENTHEAIISRETFELAQRIRVKRWHEGEGRKKNKSKEQHLFSGFLICAACGAYLVHKKKKNRPAHYICGRYNNFGRKRGGCTTHHILEDRLVNYLVEDIEQMARETNVQNLLADAYNKSIRLPTVKIDEEVKRLENKIIEKKRQQRMVYFDRIKGNVNEALYIEVAAEIEKEITVLNAGILRLKEELIKTRQVEESIQKTNSGQIQININDIDRMFLEKFIKKIIIIDNGEEISESIKEKYNLDLIFTGEQLGKISHRKIRLIILYK